MQSTEDDYKKLQERLERLLQKQAEFQQEIEQLRQEVSRFGGAVSEEKSSVKISDPVFVEPEISSSVNIRKAHRDASPESTTGTSGHEKSTTGSGSNLERFIGENLINKIGIVILVIGVAIGANYAYEHSMLSPVIRIIGGYAAGLILLGLAFRLKVKYENYSAVLVSGAVAILYFITYAAYDFYQLIPISVSFVLMLIFTVFTVLAALRFDRQIIAHLGLVGAYALPFLLGRHMNKAGFFFSYITIINLGILAIAVKKYWKSLYYSSFGLTWLIYLVWYIFKDKDTFTTGTAVTFLIIFFVIFYATFLTYKLLQKEQYKASDIVLLLSNSFVFYGLGYSILSDHAGWEHYLGLFTLMNGIVHAIVGVIIFSNKLADRNLLNLVSGLVLVFLTIAIPVQLNGHWVTLLWIGEAAVLFRIGRTKKTAWYEIMSYALICLAFISLVQDWTLGYGSHFIKGQLHTFTPIFNINFLGSFLFIVAMVFINSVHFKHRTAQTGTLAGSRVVNYFIPLLLIVVVYFSFWKEIAGYWQQRIDVSAVTTHAHAVSGNQDMAHFKTIWLINYSQFFIIVFLLINEWKIKSQELGWLCLTFGFMAVLVFLTQGLYELSELRVSYLNSGTSAGHLAGAMHIWIRYISILFFAGLLVEAGRERRRIADTKFSGAVADLTVHFAILWLISSELIHWLDMAGTQNLYKLGLSILWGVYALFVMVLGIWKKKTHLRIGSIVLFSVTLLKMFFYDMSHLNKISRMIIFICLGALLLIVSFLYTRYKQIIFPDEEE